MKKRLHRAWDALTLYLPVVLMGLLAMATWWLVRSTPVPRPAAEPAAPRHEPDYFLKNFSIKSFDAQGRLQNEIQGTQARHYPDTDTLEIDQARMRALAPDGRVTLASAERALTNADGSEVQLFGNAIVTREAQTLARGKTLPRLQFQSEFLHAWTRQERVRTHLPVTLVRGKDQWHAESMEYDHLHQVLQLQGRVRGTIAPATP